MKGDKIFITGATGFLGSYLAKELVEKGYQLRALHRRDNIPELLEPYAQEIEWVKGGLEDFSQLNDLITDCQHIFHVAARVSFQSKDELMRRINVDATTDLVNIALAKEVKTFFYVSSVAALSSAKKVDQIAEVHFGEKMEALSDYGKSKFLGEKEVWRGMAEGLNVLVVNPSVVLGPGDWRKGSPALFKRIHDGWNWYTEGTTGYVGVWDVVKFSVALFEQKKFNERYILNAENSSFKKVFDAMAKGFDREGPKRVAGRTATKWVARLDSLRAILSGKKPFLTPQLVRSLHQQKKFDNQKVRETLQQDFEPLDEVIARTCKIYHDRGMTS